MVAAYKEARKDGKCVVRWCQEFVEKRAKIDSTTASFTQNWLSAGQVLTHLGLNFDYFESIGLGCEYVAEDELISSSWADGYAWDVEYPDVHP